MADIRDANDLARKFVANCILIAPEHGLDEDAPASWDDLSKEQQCLFEESFRKMLNDRDITQGPNLSNFAASTA